MLLLPPSPLYYSHTMQLSSSPVKIQQPDKFHTETDYEDYKMKPHSIYCHTGRPWFLFLSKWCRQHPLLRDLRWRAQDFFLPKIQGLENPAGIMLPPWTSFACSEPVVEGSNAGKPTADRPSWRRDRDLPRAVQPASQDGQLTSSRLQQTRHYHWSATGDVNQEQLLQETLNPLERHRGRRCRTAQWYHMHRL